MQRITARLVAPAWLVVGPGDDAAVVEPERGALDVFTTDVQVEGVHFDRRFVAPDAIGHRALAVNLSDLAAMGARPRAALLSLVLPDALDVATFDGLVDGLLAIASAYRVAVVGGNISRSPGPLVVDVTAIGTVRRRRVLTRSGARPGDRVYLTGTVGDGLAGLESLRDGGTQMMQAQEQRYLRPDPRVRAGLALGSHRAASACMDLSDGLADAVRQVAQASGAGITIDADALPIADPVRRWHEARGRDPIEAALQGGDDYELLFTSRPAHHGRLRGAQRAFGGLLVTRIGEVTRERRLLLRTGGGSRDLPEGYEHFR
ncbi:MAG: thiamine-phosphate kinase [Acidobacteria bacterium]|nr:thiamine-phosphate kinase [Acidobacteriota bacterium]